MKHLLTILLVTSLYFHMPIVGTTIKNKLTPEQAQILCALQLPHTTIKPPIEYPCMFFNGEKLCIQSNTDIANCTQTYSYNDQSNTWEEASFKNLLASPIVALRDSDSDESQPLTVYHPTQNFTVITYAPEQYLNNKPIMLQDNESELPIHTFTTDGVHDFALSPDGNQIACFNRKETYQTKMIHLWNLEPLIEKYAGYTNQMEY